MASHFLMDSTIDNANLAAEFVTAYYTTAVYDYRSTIKFYDPEKALIYRQSLPDGKPAKVNEAKQFIVPDLRGHERLVVLNYSTNPLSLNTEYQTRYFNVAVIGKIVKNEKEGLLSQFSQFFTLEIINNERIAIISDSLTIIPQVNLSNNNTTNSTPTETNEHISIPASEILFEIDHRPTFLNRQNQSRRQQQQPQQPSQPQNQQAQQQNQAPSKPDQQAQPPQNQQNDQLGENKPPAQTTKSASKKKSKNSSSNRFVYTPQ